MDARPAAPRPGKAGSVLDRLTLLVRVSTRATLAQGAGLVGLAWCLVQGLPAVAAGLVALLLVDQALFLRGRPAQAAGPRLSLAFEAWCAFVSVVDLFLLCATVLRAAGLRDGGGAVVADPLSCLAAAVAAFAHADLGLRAASGGGRLLVAVEGLLGAAAFCAAVGAAVLIAVRRGSALNLR